MKNFIKQNWFKIVLLLLIGGFVFGYLSTKPKSVDTKEQIYSIGDTATLNDYSITLKQAISIFPYEGEIKDILKNTILAEQLVAVEIVFQDIGESDITHNPYQVLLVDTTPTITINGNKYNYAKEYSLRKKPEIVGGYIQPNTSRRGWITFNVPKISKNFELWVPAPKDGKNFDENTDFLKFKIIPDQMNMIWGWE